MRTEFGRFLSLLLSELLQYKKRKGHQGHEELHTRINT